jgi:hypothetical protein
MAEAPETKKVYYVGWSEDVTDSLLFYADGSWEISLAMLTSIAQ